MSDKNPGRCQRRSGRTLMGEPCWRNPDVWCDCRGGVERAQCDEREGCGDPMAQCTADSECGCEECTTTCQGCGCYGYEIVWYDDLHTLRALLTQTNAPGSFQRRLIRQIDATLEELSRSRRARRTGNAGAGPR